MQNLLEMSAKYGKRYAPSRDITKQDSQNSHGIGPGGRTLTDRFPTNSS